MFLPFPLPSSMLRAYSESASEFGFSCENVGGIFLSGIFLSTFLRPPSLALRVGVGAGRLKTDANLRMPFDRRFYRLIALRYRSADSAPSRRIAFHRWCTGTTQLVAGPMLWAIL